MKCNLSHHYSKCDKISEIPPNYVHFNGAHLTNYKECTYFKNVKNKKTNCFKKSHSTENEPLKDITINEMANSLIKKTTNITSYANILKGKQILPKIPKTTKIKHTLNL